MAGRAIYRMIEREFEDVMRTMGMGTTASQTVVSSVELGQQKNSESKWRLRNAKSP